MKYRLAAHAAAATIAATLLMGHQSRPLNGSYSLAAATLRGRVGWLFALSDEHMRAAITSMHDEPAHDWTVEELGLRAGMSRSIFALRFKQTVGVSPMEYLTRWRMLLAGDRIANTSDSISENAQFLGYDSASAFTKAFRESWAVRRGNIAVIRTQFPLDFAMAKRLAPIGSNPSSLICVAK